VARQTIVQLTDDLDGSEAEETVALGFRGVNYELDLNTKNAAALEKALSKYLDVARRVSSSRPTKTRGTRRASSARGDAKVPAIREWARENGYQVSDRGRIAAEIRSAYEAASS
jgi:hypothetical protein